MLGFIPLVKRNQEVQRDEYLAVEFYPEGPHCRSGGMNLASCSLVSIHAEICTYICK